MFLLDLWPLGQCQGQVQRRGSGKGCETWPLAGTALAECPTGVPGWTAGAASRVDHGRQVRLVSEREGAVKFGEWGWGEQA